MNITRKAWWLIGTCAIYILAAIINQILTGSEVTLMYIQGVWIIIMSMPLWILPLRKIIFNHS